MCRPPAALLVLLLAAAATLTVAEKCGPKAGGAKCKSRTSCCNKYGYCGTGPLFCRVGVCLSGACSGSAGPRPKPRPSPKPRLPSAASGVKYVEVAYFGRMRLACSGGATVAVRGVRYGNPPRKCLSQATNQKGYKFVARLCNGKRGCDFKVLTTRFGNPCPGVPKTLLVAYRCSAGSIPMPSPSPKPQPSPQPQPGGSVYSPLWGKAGELWRATSQLTDQSFSGYMARQAQIPNYPVKVNVRSYGATGNGQSDDTAAFKQAIAAAATLAQSLSDAPKPGLGFQNNGRAGVAILVPAGVYRITQTLEIEQSNVVLRGAGMDRTVLYFPKSLSDIYGNKEEWAASGSFISIAGFNPGFKHAKSALSAITAPARRASKRLMVESTTNIPVGKWVRIVALERYAGPSRRLLATAGGAMSQSISATALAGNTSRLSTQARLPLTAALRRALEVGKEALQYDEAGNSTDDGVTAAAAVGSLDAYLYGDMPDLNSGKNAYDKADHINFVSRVTSKGPNWIQLERPLNYDLRLNFQPYVYEYAPRVQHSGFEGFTIKFAPAKYPEHHTAYGFNGVGIYDSGNCWIRNVKVVNADNAVGVFRSDLVTVDDVVVTVEQHRYTQLTYPNDGHHALWGFGAVLTLFNNFRIVNTMYYHDVTFAVFSENLVFANGAMMDGNIDFHRGGPHNSLASNINLGRGTRAFRSGGNVGRGTHSAANNTVWNVMPAGGRPVAVPSCDFGPLLVLAGHYLPPIPGADDSDNGDRRRSLLAGGLRAPWCTSRRWWVQDVPEGQQLLPRDLAASMVATRKQRIGCC